MKNELTMNDKPMIAVGRSNLAMQQVLDLLVVRHRFLIRFDFSSKSVQKLANLCKKYPPKVIIIYITKEKSMIRLALSIIYRQTLSSWFIKLVANGSGIAEGRDLKDKSFNLV